LPDVSNAWGLSDGSPRPTPEVLDTLSDDELVDLYRKLLRCSLPRSRRDEAEAKRLSRLSDEEFNRLYWETMGLPADGDLPELPK
jgi:hypothetical protein